MIPVSLPNPPAHYWADVQQPGVAFLATTPNPTNDEWDRHRYWREIHGDLYQWHEGVCVYCASWTPPPRQNPRGVDHTSIDHFVPKSKNQQLAYEWSNFRLVRSKLNHRKDAFEDVIDPCTLQPGSFRINFTTFYLGPDPNLHPDVQARITATIVRLRLNDDPAYVNERARTIYRYAGGRINFPDLQKLYPFIASEITAQNFDIAFRPSFVAVLAKRPWLMN